MDFWQQFWTTMWGALAGAIVAGGVTVFVAWRSWAVSRDSQYRDRFDDALSGLFSHIRDLVDKSFRDSTDVIRVNWPPKARGLLVEVDRVHMLARGQDAHMMVFVGKVVYRLPRRSHTWIVANLPDLVASLRMWRTGEVGFAETMRAVESLDG